METFTLTGWAGDVANGVQRPSNQLIISASPIIPDDIKNASYRIGDSSNHDNFSVICIHPEAPDIFVCNVANSGNSYRLDLKSTRGYRADFTDPFEGNTYLGSAGKPNIEPGIYIFSVKIELNFLNSISNTVFASAIIDSDFEMFDEETSNIQQTYFDLEERLGMFESTNLWRNSR